MVNATAPLLARLKDGIDRSSRRPLKDQICAALKEAVVCGQLRPGTRLPSWQDLSTQLGVSRGTVRAAYDRLIDEHLVFSAGARGTFVGLTPAKRTLPSSPDIPAPLRDFFPTFSDLPLPFQLGVPAQDEFPAKLWARLGARCAQKHAVMPASYPDPRGEPKLRQEIAAYLAVARGIRASPDRIIITNGHRAALKLVVDSLQLIGRQAWIEDPGYIIARLGLTLAGIAAIGVPVDQEGINVARGIQLAPKAAFAIVTPGQQAPLGVALSSERRTQLLTWASSAGAWIVEDDYLGELQLDGRPAPALAADDPAGRVVYVGTFSKSISPSLALGFVVVPASVAGRFGEIAALHFPAPCPLVQHLVADFLAGGHFLRHLRKMKRIYRARRDDLIKWLKDLNPAPIGCLALLIAPPEGVLDHEVCNRAYAKGLSPTPLSLWFQDPASARHGLILCVTNCKAQGLERSVETLRSVLKSR